jgi:hypothetical protein
VAGAGASVLGTTAASANSAPSGVLAFTGSRLLPLVLLGAVLIALGAFALAAQRRRDVTL